VPAEAESFEAVGCALDERAVLADESERAQGERLEVYPRPEGRHSFLLDPLARPIAASPSRWAAIELR
jgi:hypothetical protein